MRTGLGGRTPLTAKLVEPTPSAYSSPLLIRNILNSGLGRAPDQEIVYANKWRMTYRELGERVGRLASGLATLGVRPGDTVAVMDWDSHRYLECFFAVPMMGAVLHTVNVRLSPEQVLHTINHAEDEVILVNSEFLPLLTTMLQRGQALYPILEPWANRVDGQSILESFLADRPLPVSLNNVFERGKQILRPYAQKLYALRQRQPLRSL